MNRLHFLILSFLVSTTNLLANSFGPKDVRVLEVSIGTLSIARPPLVGVIFSSGTMSHFYDCSMPAILSSSGFDSIPIPGLTKVGIRLADGRFIDYRKVVGKKLTDVYKSLRSEDDVKSIAFETISGDVLEVPLKHGLKVSRVKLQVTIGYVSPSGIYTRDTEEYTFWSALNPERPEK